MQIITYPILKGSFVCEVRHEGKYACASAPTKFEATKAALVQFRTKFKSLIN